eukprot:7385636-Prymnesium_polylepis.1
MHNILPVIGPGHVPVVTCSVTCSVLNKPCRLDTPPQAMLTAARQHCRHVLFHRDSNITLLFGATGWRVARMDRTYGTMSLDEEATRQPPALPQAKGGL